MYSLNQVNKLVSCGRDPARSLPFWRGFLLIPLILVCLAVTPQTRAINPPPDGCYPLFNTAEGCQALFLLTGTGTGNTGLGWRALFTNGNASFNTGVGAGALILNGANENTAVGAVAMLLNSTGTRNTAVGTGALLLNTGSSVEGEGSFNDAVGDSALNNNTTGFSNNALGDSALFRNVIGAANTGVGDLALEDNDSNGNGNANNNVGVGAGAFQNNVDGSENTGVGTGVGPATIVGFNNTYIGNFVGTLNSTDEDSTIRIGDVSNGNGAGSLECYIGGIWNNLQPVGGTVVAVTVDLSNDHLGYDPGAARGVAPAMPHRNAPQPRLRPQPRQAMLDELQATVAQQQKQIETLTAQLREQAAQLQKVSAQVEMIRPTPRVVENR